MDQRTVRHPCALIIAGACLVPAMIAQTTTPAPFRVEEATIAEIHTALKACNIGYPVGLG
jgi:hypothetical protein